MSSGRSQQEIARERLADLVSVIPKKRGVVCLALRQGGGAEDDLMGEVELTADNRDEALNALSNTMVRWATSQGRRMDMSIVGLNEKGEKVWRGSLPIRPDDEDSSAPAMDNGANLYQLVTCLANANLALIKQNIDTTEAVAKVLKNLGDAASAVVNSAAEGMKAASKRAESAEKTAQETQALLVSNQELAREALDSASKTKGELEGLVGDALKAIVTSQVEKITGGAS